MSVRENTSSGDSESGDSEGDSEYYSSESGDSEGDSEYYSSESGDSEWNKLMPRGLSKRYRCYIEESKCLYCTQDLYDLPITMYKHDDGWFVPDSTHRWWLYIECPKCKHQRSLLKMGVGHNVLLGT
jgi:hypothetical protein